MARKKETKIRAGRVKRADIPEDQRLKRGAPEKRPDDSIVEGLARLGCTNDEIATTLSMSDQTLVKYSQDALKKGRAFRKVSLRRSLDKWVDKHVGAMIFVAKNDLAMSDNLRHDVEVSGKGGGAIESVVYIVSVPDNQRNTPEENTPE